MAKPKHPLPKQDSLLIICYVVLQICSKMESPLVLKGWKITLLRHGQDKVLRSKRIEEDFMVTINIGKKVISKWRLLESG